MKTESDCFLKSNPETTTEKTRHRKNGKWNQRSKQQKFKNRVLLLSMREIPSVQKVAIKQQATKLNNMLSQSLTQGQVELLKLGL